MKDKETETLKPCPFCNGAMERVNSPGRYCRHAWRSPDCPIVQGAYAITQWNTRPATMEDRALDALEELCEAHSAYEHARNCSVRNVVEQKLTAFIEAEMEARALLREAGRVK